MPPTIDPSRGKQNGRSPFAFRRVRGARTLEGLGLGLLLLLGSWAAPARAQNEVGEPGAEAAGPLEPSQTEPAPAEAAQTEPPAQPAQQVEPTRPAQVAPAQPEQRPPLTVQPQYDDVTPEPGDLAISGAEARVSEDGSTLEVRAAVANQGDGRAGPAALEVSTDWGEGARSRVPPLEPGRSLPFEANLRVPPDVEPGRHPVRFVVRPSEPGSEENVRNNDLAVEVTIARRPDLRLEDVVASPDEDRRTVAVRGVVRNVGGSKAPPGRVEVATDWNATEAVAIPSLEVERSAPFAFELPVQSRVASDHHVIELFVRAAQGRAESNAENNRWTGRVALLGDLALSRVEVRTSEDASTARVRVTVRNDGIARMRRTELVLRTDWQETRRLPVPALDAGDARSFSASFDLADDVAKDRDAIRLAVDPRNSIDEADEGNNRDRVSLELAASRSGGVAIAEELLAALVALGLALLLGAVYLVRRWIFRWPKITARLVNDGLSSQRVSMSEPAERPHEILLRARVDRGRQEIRMAPELPKHEGDQWLRPTSP